MFLTTVRFEVYSKASTIDRDLKQGRRQRQWKRRWKKWICVLSNVFLDPLNMSNAGDFSWSWIFKDFIQVQKEEGKICRRMSTSSIKRQTRRFHVVVVRWTSKKCTKKRDARAFKPIVFFGSRRCGRRRSCLSSLLKLTKKSGKPPETFPLRLEEPLGL